jgi:phosphoserine phosphatase RsbU/P
MNREIEIAREVQKRLFPQRLPQVAGLAYCGRCRTALGVGGDYYDFLALPEGRLGVALGDISGKGIPAALMMAILQLPCAPKPCARETKSRD